MKHTNTTTLAAAEQAAQSRLTPAERRANDEIKAQLLASRESTEPRLTIKWGDDTFTTPYHYTRTVLVSVRDGQLTANYEGSRRLGFYVTAESMTYSGEIYKALSACKPFMAKFNAWSGAETGPTLTIKWGDDTFTTPYCYTRTMLISERDGQLQATYEGSSRGFRLTTESLASPIPIYEALAACQTFMAKFAAWSGGDTGPTLTIKWGDDTFTTPYGAYGTVLIDERDGKLRRSYGGASRGFHLTTESLASQLPIYKALSACKPFMEKFNAWSEPRLTIELPDGDSVSVPFNETREYTVKPYGEGELALIAGPGCSVCIGFHRDGAIVTAGPTSAALAKHPDVVKRLFAASGTEPRLTIELPGGDSVSVPFHRSVSYTTRPYGARGVALRGYGDAFESAAILFCRNGTIGSTGPVSRALSKHPDVAARLFAVTAAGE
jgi:hypothetical protein